MINERKAGIVGAFMALSNMSFTDQFDKAAIMRYKGTGDAGSDICHIAGHLIESDIAEDAFMDEANAWEETVNRYHSLKAFAEDYPFHEAFILAIDAREDI